MSISVDVLIMIDCSVGGITSSIELVVIFVVVRIDIIVVINLNHTRVGDPIIIINMNICHH